jgi:protein-S-isoprenylcysteine O-methyltransferase Ste14
MKRKHVLLLGLLGVALVARRYAVHLPTDIPAFAIDKAVLSHPEYTLAMLGWVLFSLYWEIAKRNASAAAVSESQVSRGVHVVLANLAALMVVIPIQGMGRFLPVSFWWMGAGLVVEAAGLGIAIWARRHLAEHWSGEITIKVGHRLIRSGPYKTIRHPIYTGILALYAGTTLVTGEWLALIGLGLAAVAYWRKIRLEEANLLAAFGSDYEAYRRESWALLRGIY